jgi:hypothetical protein
MLKLDTAETIAGLTVYADDSSWNTFYVLPNSPRFRFDNGVPMFKFIKYRLPVDRPDGKKGGGFAFFDVEFTVPEDQLKAVTAQLQARVDKIFANFNMQSQPVRIGQLTFTKGTASLNLQGVGGTLVEKVWNPGSPSLYGKFITPFTVEFTPEGATVFEQALQGKGGLVQVAYDIWTTVKLPPMHAHGHWDAQKFYSFFQKIETDETWYGADEARREQVIEQSHNSEARQLVIDSWGGITDPNIQNQIRDSLNRTFDDAIARNLIKEATPVSDENRKLPDGIENVTRSMVNDKTANVDVVYEENMTLEWNPQPRGMLPNITNYPGIKWEDYFVEIDADDPFFRQLNVPITVNADFEKLPLHSIEVHLEYNQGNTHRIEEPVFKSPNDVFKFSSFIENNIWKYKYWYQVNYKGESKTFKSQDVETDEKSLVINVDDSGILHINIHPGDIDFSKIPQIQVAIQYEDKGAGVDLIEEQFTLDKDNKEHEMVKVIFQPRRNQYRYRVKYFMADGKVYQKDWTNGQSNQLFINSPFSATQVIHLRSLGDMEQDITNIFVDLKYEDAANNYIRTESLALNKSNPFIDWSIPVVSETGGKVTYSGSIQHKDGTTEDIPPTEAKTNTIALGKIRDMLQVQVLPDLIDFSTVKLAKVSLSYQDQANGIDERKDVIFKPDSAAVDWILKLKDKSKNSYQWQATFFMKDGSTKKTDPITTSEPTVLPEVSAAH